MASALRARCCVADPPVCPGRGPTGVRRAQCHRGPSGGLLS